MTPTSARLALLSARFGADHFAGDLAAGTRQLIAEFPEPRRQRMDSAAAHLAKAAKVLLLACLPPGDELLAWTVAELPLLQRELAEREFRNASAYLHSKTEAFGLSPRAPILVEDAGCPFEVTIPDLARWVAEVAVITAGWTIRLHEGRPWLAFVGADQCAGAPFSDRHSPPDANAV